MSILRQIKHITYKDFSGCSPNTKSLSGLQEGITTKLILLKQGA